MSLTAKNGLHIVYSKQLNTSDSMSFSSEQSYLINRCLLSVQWINKRFIPVQLIVPNNLWISLKFSSRRVRGCGKAVHFVLFENIAVNGEYYCKMRFLVVIFTVMIVHSMMVIQSEGDFVFYVSRLCWLSVSRILYLIIDDVSESFLVLLLRVCVYNKPEQVFCQVCDCWMLIKYDDYYWTKFLKSAALRCYACSYTSTADHLCLNDPISVTGGIVNCNKKYCTIFRQELQTPSGRVNSFLRDCQEEPVVMNNQIFDFKNYAL